VKQQRSRTDAQTHPRQQKLRWGPEGEDRPTRTETRSAEARGSNPLLTVEGQRDFDGLTLIGYEALKRVVIPDICHRPPAQSPPMPKSELAPSLSANSARSAKVVLQHKSKVVAPVQKA